MSTLINIMQTSIKWLQYKNLLLNLGFLSWTSFCFVHSGTAIMQDGNTMRNNYGCDLDSLTTGSRIGMMRSASGNLHYYINGVDQGVACSGLPPGKDPPASLRSTGTNQLDIRVSVCVFQRCLLSSICTVSVFRCPSPAPRARWTTVCVPATSPRRASPFTPQVQRPAERFTANTRQKLFDWKVASSCFVSLLCVFAAAGVAHHFHSKHGKNVVLLGEGCQAIRIGGYAHGIAFSAKELRADELFEVGSPKKKITKKM